MNPFMKKKKPAFGGELEEPEALDAPAQAPPKPAMAKQPPAAPPAYRPQKPMMEDAPTDEPMGDEGGGGYGAKLEADIVAVGESHGMDPDQSRAYASDLLGAIAECLRPAAPEVGGGEAMGAEPEGSY